MPCGPRTDELRRGAIARPRHVLFVRLTVIGISRRTPKLSCVYSHIQDVQHSRIPPTGQDPVSGDGWAQQGMVCNLWFRPAPERNCWAGRTALRCRQRSIARVNLPFWLEHRFLYLHGHRSGFYYINISRHRSASRFCVSKWFLIAHVFSSLYRALRFFAILM